MLQHYFRNTWQEIAYFQGKGEEYHCSVIRVHPLYSLPQNADS